MWKSIIFLLIFSQSAFAYKFTKDFQNGFYWQNLPISITVVENSDPSLKSTLETLTENAVNEWHQSTGLTLWNYQPGIQSSNVIRWTKKFKAETSMDEASVLAVAIRYTDGPYFAKTEIVINGNHPLNYNLTYLFTTIKHELGHTMGLDHSDVRSSIMWPELQGYGVGIDTDDVQGMTAAHDTMVDRQLTRYVSPLAYEESSQTNGMSCGTVTTTQSGAMQGLFSLISGILISFVRRLKSRLSIFKFFR